MKRILVAVGLGVVGVVFALGLTVGALAVAGPDVGEPPTVPVLDRAGDTSVTPSPSVSPDRGGNRDDDRNGKNDDRGSPKPTDSPSSAASTDDHSGASSDDSPSEDHDSGSEDHDTDPGEHEEPDDD